MSGPLDGTRDTRIEPATLLYIEDQLANLALFETILWDQPQWRIMPAMQGRLALELSRRHPPHLVLLHARLPDISVEDALKQLHAATAEVPVIVITADTTQSVVESYLAAGAYAVLFEPINVAAFLDLLRRLSRRAQEGRELVAE
jgi:DNA-binding NtrC family response regulator